MSHTFIGRFISVFCRLGIVLVLNACTATTSTSIPMPTVLPSTTQAAAPACPSASEGTQLLTNEEYGYCLLYSDGYIRVDALPYEVCLVPGEPFLACHSANLIIEVEDAAGRTAGQIADEMIAEAEAAIPGIEIHRTDLTVSGEQAVVLEGMPGANASRIVMIVHADRFYRLMFIPWDEAGENFAQLETLYNTVINSFTFLQ